MSEIQKDWLKIREEFVKNLNGTTREEILFQPPISVMCLFISVSIKFWIVLELIPTTNVIQTSKYFKLIMFLTDFLTIIVPITAYLTIFSDWTISVFAFLLTLCLFIVTVAISSVNYRTLYWRIPNFQKLLLCDIPAEKHVCLTYLRTLIFITTSITILAVDFHIFPRRFAKTENYGVSLMDLGVGMYVLASSVVAKTKANNNVKENFRESLSLVCFGVLRCIIMQNITYQKHVTEYGSHWNFFITLGLVKLIAHHILRVFGNCSLACGIFLLFLHEYLLSTFLEEFVMSDLPREDFITANREGIVSLPGYFCLYLFGIATKHIVGNVDEQVKQTVKSKLKCVIILLALAIFLFFTLKWLEPNKQVSRRLANLSYVLWTTLFCYETLILSLMFELAALFFLPMNVNSKSDFYQLMIPDLCESINSSAFPFFLISNLLTGLVNMHFDVLSFQPPKSMFVLLCYMFLNCIVVFILFLCNIKLKL